MFFKDTKTQRGTIRIIKYSRHLSFDGCCRDGIFCCIPYQFKAPNPGSELYINIKCTSQHREA